MSKRHEPALMAFGLAVADLRAGVVHSIVAPANADPDLDKNCLAQVTYATLRAQKATRSSGSTSRSVSG